MVGRPIRLCVLVAALVLNAVGTSWTGPVQAASLRDFGRTKVDTSRPTKPASVRVKARGRSALKLGWKPSRDNVRVAGYRLYRDRKLVGKTKRSTYLFSGLRCGTRYQLRVAAFDAAGNRSPRRSVRAATRACAPQRATPRSPLPSTPPVPSLPSEGAFFVSATGADSNPGTVAAPWRTLQKAIDTLNPGQAAFIRGGTYAPATCRGPSDSGSATEGWVTLAAHPGERVVVTSADDYVFKLHDCDYFRIEGLTIRGPSCLGCNLVYGAHDSDHVQLIGNEITGSRCQGIFTEETTSFWEIVRNRIHHNGSGCDDSAHGIYIESSDSLVASNVIHDHLDPGGYGIQHYPDGSRTRIVGNTITNSATRGGIVIGGPHGVTDCVVANNVLTHNATFGVKAASTRPKGCSVHHNLGFANGDANVDPALNAANTVFRNLSGDPKYRNHPARDLRVESGSPAIDAADPALAVPDFFGIPRPVGAGSDIGAFER